MVYCNYCNILFLNLKSTQLIKVSAIFPKLTNQGCHQNAQTSSSLPWSNHSILYYKAKCLCAHKQSVYAFTSKVFLCLSVLRKAHEPLNTATSNFRQL